MSPSPRERLLAAAPVLATRLDYDELSIAHLCSAAGVTRPEFKATFGELPAYFEALQRQFYESLRTRMLKTTAGTSPGLLRVQLASESYLGHCLENTAVLRWLRAARCHSAIRRSTQQLAFNYGLLLEGELRAAACPRAAAMARLYLAMLNEVANSERRHGARLPAHRQALWHFLGHSCTAAPRALSAA